MAAWLLLLAVSPALPETAQSCESSPAVEAAYWSLDGKLNTATFKESLALREQNYKDMQRLDPRDFRPVWRYLSYVRYQARRLWETLRTQVIEEGRTHPDDPVKVSAAAYALSGRDTAQSFRLLEQLNAAKPDYAPAQIWLAVMYGGYGTFTDKDKAATFLNKYYQHCPGGRDEQAMRLMKQLGTKEMKEQVARDLRKRLAAATDSYFVRSYADVWSLEFATLPVAEHPHERQRVTEDLKRLEQLPVEASANWLGFLRDGYKQSSEPDKVDKLESRIAKEFPESDEALGIESESWDKEHPRPGDEASADEWQKYLRLSVERNRRLQKAHPERTYADSIFSDLGYLDGVSNEELIREGEACIRETDRDQGEGSWVRTFVANVWMYHSLQPARVLALLKEARTLKDSPQENFKLADYAKPKEVDDWTKNKAFSKAGFTVTFLRACRAAGGKAAAEELKAAVEAAPPADSRLLPNYWQARGLLAEIEGHSTDALAFYQKTLLLRDPPKKFNGKVNDVALADAHRLWTASQGSEEAFAVWSTPDTAAKAAVADGRWQKPGMDLPAFELSDLQGKTWKLSSFEGKKVLINIWATWCGPCMQEMPHLEKLYQQTKGRSDVAIITLNFDEDTGLIDPFVKKKGYTFPVLPAYAFLRNKIDVNSIPRNWLINSDGHWLWEQIGFGAGEADWEKSMLTRLENTK